MAAHEKLSHSALFGGFFRAGIIGFGGVLPFARRLMVEQWRWLTAEEFNDLFSLCQFMPGANIVNMAFAFGARHQGVSGAAAAVTGLLAAPMAIVLVLGGLYGRFGGIAVVQHGLAGLAAAACGLVAATALKIAWPVVRKKEVLFLQKKNQKNSYFSRDLAAFGKTPAVKMSFFASFFAKKEVLASFSGRGLAVTLLAFGLVVIGHVSLPLTMLVMLPVSLVMAWRL
jgi:chromate transporter